MANYHYIVSSLVDYSIENDAKGFDIQKLCDELKSELSCSDWSKLSELWWFFDLRNILELRAGRKGVYSPLANLTKSEVEMISKYYSQETVDEIEKDQLPSIPEGVSKVLLAYKDDSFAAENEMDTTMPLDNKIWSVYFDMALTSSSNFIRNWSSFDLDIRNISAAYTARLKNRSVESVLIGNNEIVKLILRNENVQDFGLKNEFSHIDELLQILGEKDMLTKERNLDKLRIKVIDDLVSFDYFNMEMILAYMVKISLLARWSGLAAEEGSDVLKLLTERLTAKEVIANATN